ncbi:MAG: hypothetical protein HKN87_18075 [Saprospiraceae bacterium]|nr:hypothetical protein [Saprospiraceae bacterium]
MKRAVVFLFSLLMLPSLATSQTKEDLIAILDAITELPEVDPVFQAEVSGGPALVLMRPNDRKIAASGGFSNELLYDLQNHDLTFLSRPVQIMTEGEASQYGLQGRHLTILTYRFLGDQEASILMSCMLQEGDRTWQGLFSLVNDFGSWIVKGKNIQTR